MICENHKKKEKNPVRSKKKGAHREFGWPHRVQLYVCAEDLQWGFTKHMCRPGSARFGSEQLASAAGISISITTGLPV